MFTNTNTHKWPVYIAIPFALSTSLWGILAEVTGRPIFDYLLLGCAGVVLFLCVPLNWYANRKKDANEGAD